MNWYLLQTKPNAHRLAQEHLKRQGFEVFMPLMKKTKKSGSKFVIETIPFLLVISSWAQNLMILLGRV